MHSRRGWSLRVQVGRDVHTPCAVWPQPVPWNLGSGAQHRGWAGVTAPRSLMGDAEGEIKWQFTANAFQE